MRLASWRWGNRSTGSSLRSVRLDGFLPYALQSGDVAGAVVVVVNDREVLIQKGYGYADVAKRTRGTRNAPCSGSAPWPSATANSDNGVPLASGRPSCALSKLAVWGCSYAGMHNRGFRGSHATNCSYPANGHLHDHKTIIEES